MSRIAKPTLLAPHSIGDAGQFLDLALAHPERVSSIDLIASAGLEPGINVRFADGIVSARRRTEIKPHPAKGFADSSLITR